MEEIIHRRDAEVTEKNKEQATHHIMRVNLTNRALRWFAAWLFLSSFAPLR